jgi:hypothetical protein
MASHATIPDRSLTVQVKLTSDAYGTPGVSWVHRDVSGWVDGGMTEATPLRHVLPSQVLRSFVTVVADPGIPREPAPHVHRAIS